MNLRKSGATGAVLLTAVLSAGGIAYAASTKHAQGRVAKSQTVDRTETRASRLPGAATETSTESAASRTTTTPRVVTQTTSATQTTTPTVSSTTTSSGTLTGAQVTQVALDVASGFGDADPTSLKYALSTRQAAVAEISEDQVSGSEPAFAVVMTGKFAGPSLPRPPDAPAPAGPVLALVIDATTGQVSDFGIKDDAPDLADLGQVAVARP
jgi:hypothetical protein